MRLYSGTSEQFITDTVQNQIADKLKDAFFASFRFNPSPGEMNSWRNSLKSISLVFQYAKLLDHGIILEYQLPLTSCRLDCLIMGRDSQNYDNAVIIELKQWDKCQDAEGENEVLTWVGHGEREVLHPSAQVGRYKMFLQDGHSAFYEGDSPVSLSACSYLHKYRYEPEDVLVSDKFVDIIEKYPIFSTDDVDPLCEFLSERLERGEGLDVLRRIEEGKYRPSKKLMEHVGNIIKGIPEYILLDEQLIAYDKVIACAKKGFHDKQKRVILIKGGPGTGKSVIAINLMADLLLKGYNSHYATGSRAFTMTLRNIIGTRGSVQFRYFNSYMHADRNAVDVLICDEAHRLRKTSESRYTSQAERTGEPQIQELIDTSKLRRILEAHAGIAEEIRPFIFVEPSEKNIWNQCVPLTTLQVAAGKFSDEQESLFSNVAEEEDWITWDDHPKFEEGMFVAKVQGKSMEPDIPDGAYCLFRPPRAGSRQGKTVLVWHAGITDPHTGGQYTVKIYESEKRGRDDGEWEHARIILKPRNPDYSPIVIEEGAEGEVRIIAEFVEVVA
jgi:SOS-response transcriptional repressor LexA